MTRTETCILRPTPKAWFKLNCGALSDGVADAQCLTAEPLSLFERYDRVSRQELMHFRREVGANQRNGNVRIGHRPPHGDGEIAFSGTAMIRALYKGKVGTYALLDITWKEGDTRYTITYLLKEGLLREAIGVVQNGSTSVGGFLPENPFYGSYTWNMELELFQ